MALDFPASPSVGQKFPSSPIVGIPSYTWDGEKWTTAVGTASGGLAVLYDKAQSLTALNQQQARQNIYAAPFDAMAYSGLQINGAMEVSQELGTTGRTTSGYVCDGWQTVKGGTMVYTAAQALSTISAGFPYCIGVTVTTAQASLGAGDNATIYQQIEGWRLARLGWGTANAQPITIGFWTAHHRAGLYSVSVRNLAANRSYIFTYTQNVADVAQYNTITIPGDITGTWAVDNTVGVVVAFCMGSGATYIAPSANAWLAGLYVAAPGQVNAVGATTDAFRITGFTVHPGNEAPSAARSPFVMRSADQELIQCWRYYERYNQIIYRSVGGNYFWLPTRVPKRVVPTVSFANASYSGTSTPTGTNTKVDGTEVNFAGTGYIFTDVIFDARL